MNATGIRHSKDQQDDPLEELKQKKNRNNEETPPDF